LRALESDAHEAGFVLAGGKSTRMGRDKALVLFRGRPLVEISAETLRQAGIPVSIAGARSDLSGFAAVVEDTAPDQGPLTGICAALAGTTAVRAVFVSVDLPLLPTSLITCLVGHARNTGRPVTVASVNGYAQTFPAVLDRAVLPTLERVLHSGQRGCYAAFEAAAAALGQPISVLPVEVLVQSGQSAHPLALPPAWWFSNVNSPADLARAESISGARNSWPVESLQG
jgi:molybdopterin-guanine dinucleotide biosynthesis protein A